MIPEEEISFEDRRPYHTIEMYKKLVQVHIGLQVRSIVNNQNNNNISIGAPIRGSFPKPESIISPTYKRCDGDERIKFPIEVDVEFTYLGKYKCFFMDCDTPINIYRYENTLFIIFERGGRLGGIHKTDDQFYANGKMKKTLYYDRLNEMLEFLYNQLDDTVNQIVLSGHSNGMGAATLLSYLLCCVKDDAFFDKNKKLDQQAIDWIEKCKIGIPRIRDISLFVVGTGGFPVLFENKEEFREYYNVMKGRYVHIICGYRENNTIFIDNYTEYLHCLLNVKFGIYYVDIDNYRSIDYFENEKCSYDVVIDDVILLPNYEKVTESETFEDFYNKRLNIAVSTEEKIDKRCQDAKDTRKLANPSIADIAKLDRDIELICDKKEWEKRFFGTHHIRFYKPNDLSIDDTPDKQKYRGVPDAQLLHYEKDGINIDYIPDESELVIPIHLMRGYRATLTIYFYS